MRTIIGLSLLLLATSAMAESNAPATMDCYFQTGEHFTVVGADGNTVIAWGNGGFRKAASAFEAPWLTVAERADNGNLFKMAFNVKTKEAYGETTFADGSKKGGPLWCAFKQ